MEKWQISYRSEDVEPLLTEYKALREEQRTRMTMNSSMVNFILLVVGAEIAAYVQMAINLKQHLFLPILLGSPLITTPITIFYYDNTLMIYRIGRYFGSVLYPNITKHIGHNNFGTTGLHTVNYELGSPTNPITLESVKLSNRAAKEKYPDGFPWTKSPKP